MKVVWTVLKVLAVLAAVAAVVYTIVAYGDKIKAWANNLICKLSGGCCCDCGCDCDCDCEDAVTETDFAG